MEKWRDEFKKDENPTWETDVICAIDEVTTSAPFALSIYHIKTLFGGNERKAFKSSVSAGGGSLCPGGRHIGTDEAAYNLALAEGERLLKDQLAKSDHSLQEEKERRQNEEK